MAKFRMVISHFTFHLPLHILAGVVVKMATEPQEFRVAFFSTRSYDREFFDQAIDRLDAKTLTMYVWVSLHSGTKYNHVNRQLLKWMACQQVPCEGQ